MNGKVIAWIIGTVGALLGVGGGAYGIDQHKKRKAEQQMFSNRIGTLEQELVAKEAELAGLRARLGDKNEQVRLLAAKVDRMRANVGALRSA